MKKISRWAKNNPRSAKVIIAISHLIVAINSVCFGILLFVYDWGESTWLLIVLANLFFISYIFYPKKTKHKKQGHSFYLRQKLHDFSLVMLYWIVIAFGINNFLIQHNNDHKQVRQPTATFIVHKSNSGNQKINRKELKSAFKKARKQIKHELRKLKKKLKQQDDNAGVIVLKILLALLTIGVAFLLGTLLALLACDIHCSGQEGLAAVIAILGYAGLIWLLVIVLNNIFKQTEKKKKVSIIMEGN